MLLDSEDYIQVLVRRVNVKYQKIHLQMVVLYGHWMEMGWILKDTSLPCIIIILKSLSKRMGNTGKVFFLSSALGVAAKRSQ